MAVKEMTKRGFRNINHPDVQEDIEFLIAEGRPNDEIAKRCNVGLYAIEKKYGKRKDFG